METKYKYKHYDIYLIKNSNNIIIKFVNNKLNKIFKEIYDVSFLNQHNLSLNDFHYIILKAFNILVYDDPNNEIICFVLYDDYINIKINNNSYLCTINLFLYSL